MGNGQLFGQPPPFHYLHHHHHHHGRLQSFGVWFRVSKATVFLDCEVNRDGRCSRHGNRGQRWLTLMVTWVELRGGGVASWKMPCDWLVGGQVGGRLEREDQLNIHTYNILKVLCTSGI